MAEERGDFVVDIDLAVDDARIAALGPEIARKVSPATESLNAASRAAASTKKHMDALSAAGRRTASSLTQAGHEAVDFYSALQQLGAGQKAITQGLKNLQTELTKQRTVQRQHLIAQREDADRSRQLEFEDTRASNSRLAIEQQRAAQSALISQRQTGQQRIQITRAVFENLGRLEKAFAATVAGTARTATSGLGRVFDTLTSRIRNTNRVFTEGTQTALTRREGLIRTSFSRQERLLSETVSRQQRTIHRLNQQISTGLTGAVTGRGVGGGIAAIGGGVGVASLLTSGFERYSNLERLNKQFLALTGSIEDTTLLLGQVREFAKKTPFDLVGVADLAKGFLAIGTATEDVLPRVTAIADAVALTGGGVDELNRIQRAIGQVVSAGRLQGDELNQLAENLPGLNIRQILADQLTGGNVRALIEMQEAGEITSDLFVNGLITGLQNDQRLVGASEDLANTLSGRVANLKESFADFGASIIGTIADPLKSAVSSTQGALQGLSDFIKGDVSKPLLVLRSALKGAAISISGLLAAKGVGEAIKLLAVAARLLITPMGILVTVVGALGALFNVMYERSPQLRMAIEALGDRFGAVGSSIAERFAPILAAVATFVSDTVLPAVDRLAGFLAANLLDAFDAVSGFITDTAYPAIRSFGEFLVGTVVPALATAGGFIARAFDAASTAVAGFAAVLRPLIQPAIDGFQQLGSAISAAFGGDFGGLASGAGAAAAGIGGALANIGESIAQALAPLARKVIDGLKDIFTTENLTEVGKAALNVIETIGYVLGNIASDPRFLAALAGIAAAAVLVAARFVEGVGRGIVENLPELASLAWEGLKKAFAAVVDDALLDPQVLAAAVTVALIAPKVIRAFQSFGEQGAAGFARGFRASLRTQGDFMSGLFGGAQGVTGKAQSRFFADLDREARSLQTTLRAFGSNMDIMGSRGGLRQGLKEAKTEIADLTRGLSDAQVRGVLMRQALSDTFSTLRTGVSGVVTGVGTMAAAFTGPLSRGLSSASAALAEFFSAGTKNASLFKRTGEQAGQGINLGFRDQLKLGVGQIGAAFSGTMAQLRQIAADNGTTIGRIIGGKIAAGLAIGVASFVAGRAEGAAGGSGALSAIGSGLTAAALGGPALGVAAAGLSLIGTAFGKASKAAADAKKRVSEYAATLKNELAEGLNIGIDGLVSFAEALNSTSFLEQVASNLEDVRGSLLAVGITMEDVTAAFRAGDISGLEQQIVGGGLSFEKTVTILEALREAYSEAQRSVKELNEERTFTGEAQRDRALGAEASRLDALARAYGVVVPKAGELTEIWGQDVQPRFTDAMQRALDDAKVKADRVSEAIDRIFGNRDPAGLAASLDAAIVSVAGSFDGLVVDGGIIDQAKLDRALEDLRVQLSDVTKAGINEGVIFDQTSLQSQTLAVLAAALDGVEDPALRDAITKTYNDGVANALPVLNTANIYDQLAAGLAEPIEVQATISDRALAAESARLSGLAKQYGVTAGGFYGEGIDAGIRGKISKIRSAAIAAVEAAKNAVDSWWDINSPSKVAIEQGGFYSEGLAIGISSGRSVIAQAAAQAAMSATGAVGAAAGGMLTHAKDTGLTIGKAIAEGLADSEADISSVISTAVDNALKALENLGSPSLTAAASAASKLFAGVTGSDIASPGGVSGAAIAAQQGAVTGAMQSFLSTFDSNVTKIFEVNAKNIADLSAADREVFGTNVFSLSQNDVFGASNLSAITGFLDDVASLGEALIAKGTPLEAVRAQLTSYIDDLVATATNLGFNREELEGLVASLGLTGSALDEFIRQVGELNAAAASPAAGAGPLGGTGGDPAADPRILPKVQQTFIVQLPTGDPYAAALTIANQQAQSAQIPGG